MAVTLQACLVHCKYEVFASESKVVAGANVWAVCSLRKGIRGGIGTSYLLRPGMSYWKRH